MKYAQWSIAFAALLAACSEEKPAAPASSGPGPKDTVRRVVQLAKEGKQDEVWPLIASETRQNAERDGNKEMMLSQLGAMIDETALGAESIAGDTATVAVKTGFGDGKAKLVREEGAWRFKGVEISMTLNP